MTAMTIKIAKLDTAVTFDIESLPPASIEYAIRYGLTQSLNDVHAGVRRKDYAGGTEGDAAFAADVDAKVATRIEQINSGNVPGMKAPADPKAAVVRKLVATLQSKGMSLDDIVAFVETKMAA